MTTNLPRWAVRGLPPWSLLVWLPICFSLLIAPLADATPGPHSVRAWLAVGAAATGFTAVVLTRYRRGTGSERLARLLLALLALLAVGSTLAWSPAWSSMFVLLAIGVGIVVVNRTAPAVILAVASGAVAVDLLAGATADSALATGLTVLLTGLGTYAVHQLFATVAELRRTREELARMAVAQERDRFGRDLHDLLGHTLSVIVVKAEAVRRLAPLDSAAAAVHAADIETIGREALVDVRRAANGYRGAGLERELSRARSALEAAGITLTLPDQLPAARLPEGLPKGLPEEVDVLLGWAVREGVTNVLRHARATRCTIAVRHTDQAVRLSIEDNGSGSAPEPEYPDAERPDPGAGLPGLAERVATAGGTVEAVPTDQGFRITVDVPVPAGRATSGRWR